MFKLWKMFKTHCYDLKIACSLTIILVILGSACKSDEDHSIKMLPNTLHESAFSLDNIAEDLIIIPLTFTEPTYTRKIVWKDPYFYISTGNGQLINAIRIVNQSGEEVNCLDRVGRGPGEYLSVQQFGVDDNRTIYVNTWHKIVVYDSNLNHMRDIKWPYDLNRAKMHVYNNHIYLFPEYYDELPEYDWIVLDTLGKIVSAKPFNYYHKIGYPPPFDLIVFQNDNKLYRYRSISDTIFEVYIDGYNTAYTIDRNYSDGYRMYSQEEISTCRRFDILMKSLYNVKLRYPESISGIGEKWIVEFRTHLRRNVHYETAMIDLQKNKLTLVNRFESVRGDPVYWGIPNDWIGFGPMKPMDVIVIDSEYYILSVMDVFKLKGLVKTETFINGVPKRPALKLKLQTLVDSLDLESDPVLFMLKVK